MLFMTWANETRGQVEDVQSNGVKRRQISSCLDKHLINSASYICGFSMCHKPNPTTHNLTIVPITDPEEGPTLFMCDLIPTNSTFGFAILDLHSILKV